MATITKIQSRGLVIQRTISIRAILGRLAEILFPHKIITLGLALILGGLLIPLSMLLQIAEESFLLFFLAFAAVISGTIVCLIGSSCYPGQ